MAVFTVAVVAGQSGSSLAVDRVGIGPGGAQPVTGAPAGRCGADRAGGPAGGRRPARRPGRAGAGRCCRCSPGSGIAWQQAVNGRVRAASGSALTATLVNFAVGTVALLVVFAVDLALRGWPAGTFPTEPWLYLGGPIGIVFIAIAAAIVRFTGVLLLGLATIAGQVVGAVAAGPRLPDRRLAPRPAHPARCGADPGRGAHRRARRRRRPALTRPAADRGPQGAEPPWRFTRW